MKYGTTKIQVAGKAQMKTEDVKLGYILGMTGFK